MIDINFYKNLYEKIYLIKRVENAIVDNYMDNAMKTPMHMSRGSESIAAGVCSACGDRGQFFGTYRSHAIYLSSGGDINKFFSEMYGKENGRFGGRAGSMHISSPESGHIASSAIVASNIPVAVGASFANKIKNNKKIVVVFFGDGAIDEGNFWESLNMACLWKLPVIFICEDNRLAVHTYKNKRQGYNNIINIIKEFNIKTYSGLGTDAEIVYNITEEAISHIDTFNQPCFIKLEYFRYLEHVGIFSDTNQNYRKEDTWKEPYDYFEKLRIKLINNNIDIEDIERNINNIVLNAIDHAKKSSFSDPKELYRNVFYVEN